MLILSRYRGQSVLLMPHPELDPKTPIGDLFRHGPIKVSILDIGPNRMRLGIDAPPGIAVLRQELTPATDPPPAV